MTRAELSILLTDDLEIRELNRRYRHVDRSTDVLAFPLAEPASITPGWSGVLGDVVISVETAERQVPEGLGALMLAGTEPKRPGEDQDGQRHDSPGSPPGPWSLADELLFLLVHGVLHLVGHDHDQEERARAMEARQRDLFAKIKAHVVES